MPPPPFSSIQRIQYSKNGTVGDKFMEMIEPVASTVPYMTTVGNVEDHDNFTHYVHLFSMPGETDNFWYSFDLGDAHFVMFSTEAYFYYSTHSPSIMVKQYKWIEEDLMVCVRSRSNTLSRKRT